ncbi:SusC/RagA family TonB-linked outer membrane protein [Chitinophaga sp.]|uniref:SusC/RagA family TonB-linked outer membrane protein n=1 Tax=Chitinophaga sp. TaxID=1869181 RepID=UPI0031D23940
MRKFAGMMIVLLLSSLLQSFGQTAPVTGTVLAEDGKTPLIGVTVLNATTKKGTQTDASGHFSIAAEKGQQLVFSYIGYGIIKINASDASKVVMKPSNGELGEVVVTAMDIKRNARELGYSVQRVSGDEIAATQRENFVNALQGRVAGVTITPTTGQAGSGSSIVLRGFNSLSLSNQPLFVVDGIIVDNQTLNQTSNGGAGIGLVSDMANKNSDYTNRAADINPADIASITVLKGPEATALYGSQASSGAIVITTKRSKGKGVHVSYDNSFRTQKITRYNKITNAYNTGTDGVYTSIFQSGSGTFFGPKYSDTTKLYDNVHNFFRTGFAQTHNLGVDFGVKNSGFRFSASYINQDGVIPNNNYKKLNLRLSNTTKIGKYVEITPSFSVINSVNNKPLRGAGGYLLDLYLWPTDHDIHNWQDSTGGKATLVAGNSPNAEVDNPVFSVQRNLSQDKNNRYIATLGININPFPWLSLAGRFGYDAYHTDGYMLYNPDSYNVTAAQNGALENYYLKYWSYNHTITATASKTYKKFNGRLMIGTMWQDNETGMYAVRGTNLTDPMGTDSSNTDPTTRTRLLRNAKGEYNMSINRNIAYFGEAAIGYNDLAFVSFTQRFETTSIMPAASRNYNYPGISASFIPSEVIPGMKTSKVLSYWKLRASMASTARLSDPYANQSVFVNNLASGGGYSYGYTNANPNLKPERQKTYEIGTEFRMFDGRINAEVSYYNTLVKDQIAQGFRASYGTGFILNTMNAASTRNKGIEAMISASPVRTKDFGWDLTLNFNKMYNKVLAIPSTLTEYYIADTWVYANARGGLMRGGSTTTITGYHYSRNNKGDILINPLTGLPVIDATFGVIGDRNPDFTLGINNTLRYKKWTLSFLWDLKVGGDVFDATDMYLTVQGKGIKTADRETARVIKGVLNDGLQNTDKPTENNIVVLPYRQQAYYTNMPEEEFLQKDVNWFRLRDLTISYNFGKWKSISNIGAFATFNDLVLITNYRGADPVSNGNTSANKGVGGFGFDYGNLPAPVSANFGLRVSF